ncbi:MAG: bifunctional adenosylcobinamide kinase/adenosylcobinamide-phosphate guanylyltransferase [Clostridiales bacterium]|nr:bifunctional adenosylcobinamide kinase/adenosylcobinamide-phosphate guanylyltransferase [Clostridiales bacterium]
MRVFISGGCKNGKSYYALRLAKAQHNGGGLFYVATMKPTDAEDRERIDRHRREREGWGFATVEQPTGIEGVLGKCSPGGSFLIDSVTALLFNEMFPVGGTSGCGAISPAEKTELGLLRVIDSIENIVIVSDYIYSDAMVYGDLTENYRKALAGIDCALAKRCDIVLEAAYSNLVVHKGKELLGKLYDKML